MTGGTSARTNSFMLSSRENDWTDHAMSIALIDTLNFHRLAALPTLLYRASRTTLPYRIAIQMRKTLTVFRYLQVLQDSTILACTLIPLAAVSSSLPQLFLAKR